MTASTTIDGWIHRASAILGWALATVRATLPPAVRNFGRHPDVRLFRLDLQDGLAEAGIRYRSLLGEVSLGDASAGARPADVQLELPEADQYRRILTISESAARRGRPALALRLHEFSPIPVEQAEFAFRLLAPREAGGYEAEVSVIRSARLQQAIDSLPGDAGSWSIVGAVDAAGQAGFHYGALSSARARQHIGLGPGLLVLGFAFVLVCLAWSDRFSRQVETLELRRIELIGFARGLREADLDIERADSARQAGAATVRLDRVVAALRALGLREPEGLGIRTITLDAPAMLVIDGPATDAEGQAVDARLELPLESAP